MPSDLLIFAHLGILVALALLFRMYAMTYRLTDTSVQVVLLHIIPVSRTKYSLIREVRIISFGKLGSTLTLSAGATDNSHPPQF